MTPQEQMHFHEKESNALSLIPSLLNKAGRYIYSQHKMHESMSLTEYLRCIQITSNRWQQHVLRPARQRHIVENTAAGAGIGTGVAAEGSLITAFNTVPASRLYAALGDGTQQPDARALESSCGASQGNRTLTNQMLSYMVESDGGVSGGASEKRRIADSDLRFHASLIAITM
jgi:hypothetical protein